MSLSSPLVRLRVLPALLPMDGKDVDIRLSPDDAFLQRPIGNNAPRGNVAPISGLRVLLSGGTPTAFYSNLAGL